MQLLPAELGMSLLMGQSVAMHPYSPDESLVRGRQVLVHLTGTDFGYDLLKWHEYLLNANMTNYKSRGAKRWTSRIANLTLDPTWIAIRNRLEETSAFEMQERKDRENQAAIDKANDFWCNKDRTCPRCQTTFRSVMDRGQCPECRIIFYASRIQDALDAPETA